MPKRPDELRELAALAQLEADHLRALADLHERRQRLGGLTSREQGRSVNKMDMDAHALATSRGRSGDPLVKAANKARLTLRELARRAGVSPSQLSMARRGTRPISASAAQTIEKLTGFKATASNWGGGISEGK